MTRYVQVPCERCGVLRWRPEHDGQRPKYCGRECAYTAISEERKQEYAEMRQIREERMNQKAAE